MLPIDLKRYPEVQLAISRKKAVIVRDIEKSELMRPCVQELRRLKFHSLMVLPVLYQEEVLGTLFLRASRKRSFTDDEVVYVDVHAAADG